LKGQQTKRDGAGREPKSGSHDPNLRWFDISTMSPNLHPEYHSAAPHGSEQAGHGTRPTVALLKFLTRERKGNILTALEGRQGMAISIRDLAAALALICFAVGLVALMDPLARLL
jgi:hypothetical protein